MVTNILSSPKVWAPLFAVMLLAFFYFLVNFGAAKNLVTNTRDLPATSTPRSAQCTHEGEGMIAAE